MTDSPLFKRAFVRGLNAELIRSGATYYPSKEAADHAADYVADHSGIADPYSAPEQITKEAAVNVVQSLIAAGEEMCKQAGGYQPEVTKTAQATTPVDTANTDAWALMEKAAAETGSLMEGGDNQNDQPAAAKDNAEAALEAERRPENYANLGEDGVGNYERKGQGNVGTEEDHPEKPKATETGTNSNIENTRKHGEEMPPGAPPEMGAPPAMGGGVGPEDMGGAPEPSPELLEGVQLGIQLAQEDPQAAAEIMAAAEGGGEAPPMAGPPMEAPPEEAPPMDGMPEKEASLAAIVQGVSQKLAAGSTGSLIDGGDVPNDQPAAVSGNAQAPGNAEAAQEANRRPENYANKGESGVGRSDFVPSKDENIGRERKHPLAPKATDSGKTNVPLEHIKSGSAFDQLFQDTAGQVVPYLPEGMDDKQKVAHVRATMGLETDDRGQYLQDLYTQLGAEKIAAAGVREHFLKQAEVVSAPPAGIKQASAPQTLSGLKDALRRLSAA